MPNEADTCRRFAVPNPLAAGWDTEPLRLSEQVTFTDGRIVVTGRTGRRRPGHLDIKNPSAAEDLEHQPPEKLVEDILAKERRIVEIMGGIKTVLGR